MRLTLLPSDKGDCLLLEGRTRPTILIDGGMPDSYGATSRRFSASWRQAEQPAARSRLSSRTSIRTISPASCSCMNDMVDWRVFDHKNKRRGLATSPTSPNRRGQAAVAQCLPRMVGDNAGEIGSMLAARAANSAHSAIRELASSPRDYQAIAASIPEAIKLSRRVRAEQLNIPLNKEFGGKLAMVREPRKKSSLTAANSPVIRILGPFEEDLDKLPRQVERMAEGREEQVRISQGHANGQAQDARFDSDVRRDSTSMNSSAIATLSPKKIWPR